MSTDLYQHIMLVLDISRDILAELGKRDPSSERLVELYQSRTPHLQQLDRMLKDSGNTFSAEEKQTLFLPRLKVLASLDKQIMSRLEELNREKEQELLDIRQESNTVASYRRARSSSKSFFTGQGLKG